MDRATRQLLSNQQAIMRAMTDGRYTNTLHASVRETMDILDDPDTASIAISDATISSVAASIEYTEVVGGGVDPEALVRGVLNALYLHLGMERATLQLLSGSRST